MEDRAPHLDALLDLDTRHDSLLRQLDELDKQVAAALRRHQAVVHDEAATEGQPAVSGSPPNE